MALFAQKHVAALILPELIAELLIVGVLCGTAVLSAKGMRRVLLHHEARRFCAELEGLRLISMQREEDLQLEIVEDGYRVTKGREPARELVMLRKLESGIKIAPLSEARSSLSFYRSGIVSPATLQFFRGEEACLVTVSLRGRIRLEC